MVLDLVHEDEVEKRRKCAVLSIILETGEWRRRDSPTLGPTQEALLDEAWATASDLGR